MIDMNYYKEIAEKVFNCDSPSGYTSKAVKLVKSLVDDLGYESSEIKKGGLKVFVKGKSSEKKYATSAHLDTLGLMVRSIKPNGNLAVTPIGGIMFPTLDGEYCKIYTRDDKCYSGTILSTSPSVHVFSDARSKSRDQDNMEIRIDEIVKSKDDVLKLGIDNGDIVCIDPKFEITDSGFIKSRFIDDKASVCILLTLLKYFKDNNLKPDYDTFFFFTVYEEVGHGASALDEEFDEFITVDMGCIGLDLAGSEYKVSIAAKDASGPYDYDITTKLINIAKENKIDYAVDIFPFYSSDVSAALRGGGSFKGALIGPGVHASHGMERTHLNAILETIKLLNKYICR